MKKLFAIFLTVFFVTPLFAYAAVATDKEAIAMVDKAITFAKTNGKEKLITEVNARNPDFAKGELYIVVASMDGVRLAHGANAKQVGKSLLDSEDVDGKPYGKEILAVAQTKGKGWVDYKFKNPVSGKIESKTSYLVRSGDFIVFAGIYK